MSIGVYGYNIKIKKKFFFENEKNTDNRKLICKIIEGKSSFCKKRENNLSLMIIIMDNENCALRRGREKEKEREKEKYYRKE